MDCQSLDALEPMISQMAGQMGFVSTTYADMSRIPLPGEPAPYFVTTLRQDFLESYLQNGFASHDPVVRLASATNAPFWWSDCQEYRRALSPHPGVKGKARMLAELANDYRYRDGFVIPCHARDAQGRPRSGIISMYRDGDRGQQESLPSWFRLAALVFHERVLALRQVEEEKKLVIPVLTDREREVLLWACRGKTNGETSDILRISERTVEFHVTNAMRKLGVYNKVHCVAVAVQLGLVCP